MPKVTREPRPIGSYSPQELRLMEAVFCRCCDQLRVAPNDVMARATIATAIVETGNAGLRSVQPLLSAGLAAGRRKAAMAA
ncbi:hypothetical protein [Phreatobacter stygius]|uniref:Uncharacterized protein n=1 Tax=Phreatobacter stygius TaxID=1940610 RepID=A0A4D7BHC3_9HYPH|nr:hypothetical protein [Phreatobacter stygius]QCI67262.1 hypothetical protein E8M01_25340 [Phreatobacter stygius]